LILLQFSSISRRLWPWPTESERGMGIRAPYTILAGSAQAARHPFQR
jgi:hypothetical protein